MSKVTKGNYYQKKSKDFLIADGWRVENLEKNQRIFTKKGLIFIKKDLWGADIIAVKGDEMMFIQCKTNRVDINKGLNELAKYPMPKWCKEEVIKSVNSYLKELAEAKKAEEIKEKTQEVIESVKEEINIPIINQ